MLTDPIADMLTRIRNANTALHDDVEMPGSTLKAAVADVLKEQGYIADYELRDGRVGTDLVVKLKYSRDRRRVISGIKRVSKPGRRVYVDRTSIPKRAGRHGHRGPLDVAGRHHRARGPSPRHRRRGHLLGVVREETGHMSRIGRAPIPIPDGVSVNITGQKVVVTGPQGRAAPHRRGAHQDQARRTARSSSPGRPTAGRIGRSTACRARSWPTWSRASARASSASSRSSASATARSSRAPPSSWRSGYSHPVTIEPPEGIAFEVPAPDAGRGAGHRQAGGRRGRRPDPRGAPARALQGQGHPLRGRGRPSQGR